MKHLDPIFAALAPGHGRHSAHARPREDSAAPPSRAICTAVRTAPATSSRWSTTASSTASWRHTPKGFGVLRDANIGKQKHAIDAETTPLRDPEHYQYDLNLRDIAEVWRRGSVIASWLLDLTAAALVEGSRTVEVRRPCFRFGRRPLDDQGRDRRRRCPVPVLTTALYERFSSRGEADFQDKLLSAMRYRVRRTPGESPRKVTRTANHDAIPTPTRWSSSAQPAIWRTRRSFRRCRR